VFAVTVTASSWHPPIGSPLEFSELNAKAVANRKGVNIVEIDGKLYGGAVNGSGAVRWDGPWVVAGEFELSNSSLSGISQAFTTDVALTGSIDMKATFSAKANNLHNLLKKPNIKANFVCRDGSIGSIDLARIVVQDTRGSTENLSRFDKLTGSMDLTNGSYQFRKINFAWGNLSASGNMDIAANKNLSGKINAEMILQSRQFRTRLDISGNLKQPQLK
jgi:uncharacterized protein involved in outer membrane biogenesis